MKSSQFGTFIVIIFSSIIAFLLFMLFKTGMSDITPLIILGSVIFILIVCILFFYQLTIYINDEYVSFKLGIGLYGKKYKINEIKSCKPVKNPLWYGIGIKILPNGILYNVSGLSAIELTFIDKKGIVRIGTNKPDEIADYINKKIGNTNVDNITLEKISKVRLALFWSITASIILLPIAFILFSKQESKIIIIDKTLEISGIYGQTILIDKITQIDTVPNIPNIELRTNGFAFGKTYKGNFKLKDIGNAKLFIEYGFSPYILIKTADNEIFYINSKDNEKTIELFQKIRELKK